MLVLFGEVVGVGIEVSCVNVGMAVSATICSEIVDGGAVVFEEAVVCNAVV